MKTYFDVFGGLRVLGSEAYLEGMKTGEKPIYKFVFVESEAYLEGMKTTRNSDASHHILRPKPTSKE